MGRIRDFAQAPTATDDLCRAFVTSAFPKGGRLPLIVPPSMLEEAREACPDAWIETSKVIQE